MNSYDDVSKKPRPRKAGDEKRPARGASSGGQGGSQDPRQQKNPQKKKTMNPGARTGLRVLAGVIMVCIIVGCVAVCAMAVYVFDILDSDQFALDLDVKRLEYTTIIYATDPQSGETTELQRLYSPDANRIWVDYEQIPQTLIDTVVAVEDSVKYCRQYQKCILTKHVLLYTISPT